jgi:putative membrane protein
MSDWQGLTIGGFAAGVTALIPGMSLSTVLIVLGVYTPLMYTAEAVMRMELSYLIPIGLFILFTVIGLMATAKGIKIVFEKYPGIANTTVLGFQFGSLVSIAYQSHHITDINFTWLLGGIMLIVGCCISIMFIVLGRIMNKNES